MEILFVIAVGFVVLLAIMSRPARKRSGSPVKYRHTSAHGAGGNDDSGWSSGDSGGDGGGGGGGGD